MPVDNGGSEQYGFLVDAARTAGAVTAAILPAGQIAVEDRVRLKCRSGCASYGRHLTCPPYAPETGEFRDMLKDYRVALVVKFRGQAFLDGSIRCSLLRSLHDPKAPPADQEKARIFRQELATDGRRLNAIMLDLERAAFNAGNPFALALTAGTCGLCEPCNTETGLCNHPTRRRFPPEAVGINVVKTAAAAGMPIAFPALGYPERIGIVLID